MCLSLSNHMPNVTRAYNTCALCSTRLRVLRRSTGALVLVQLSDIYVLFATPPVDVSHDTSLFFPRVLQPPTVVVGAHTCTAGTLFRAHYFSLFRLFPTRARLLRSIARGIGPFAFVCWIAFSDLPRSPHFCALDARAIRRLLLTGLRITRIRFVSCGTCT